MLQKYSVFWLEITPLHHRVPVYPSLTTSILVLGVEKSESGPSIHEPEFCLL